jgi:hypothetical protein
MIKATIEYINSKLAALNYFEQSFGLCEIISKGQKTFPAEYLNNGEYRQINNFDKYNGVSYLRKRGDISISDAENTIESCKLLNRVVIPLRLVCIVPRKKLDCDNNYSEDVIAKTIMREILAKGGNFKIALDARQARLQVDSYSTDSMAILNEEYSNYPKKDINYKYAYLALDLTMTALVTQDCLTRDCYGQYS